MRISASVLTERCMNQLKEVLEELQELVEQHREGGGLSFRYAFFSARSFSDRILFIR